MAKTEVEISKPQFEVKIPLNKNHILYRGEFDKLGRTFTVKTVEFSQEDLAKNETNTDTKRHLTAHKKLIAALHELAIADRKEIDDHAEKILDTHGISFRGRRATPEQVLAEYKIKFAGSAAHHTTAVLGTPSGKAEEPTLANHLTRIESKLARS